VREPCCGRESSIVVPIIVPEVIVIVIVIVVVWGRRG